MILIDSNVLIYAASGSHPELRDFIQEQAPVVSAVTYVETLGYHKLNEFEKRFLNLFFSAAKVIGISDPVLEEAVRLRQQRRMSLGDALIAGTAVVHGFRLATRNIDYFWWIAGLDVLDPL
jgi:toxin FitB